MLKGYMIESYESHMSGNLKHTHLNIFLHGGEVLSNP